MKRLTIVIAAVILTAAWSFGQGPLSPPPGTVIPTMKTLVQIEPRTNLSWLTVPNPLTLPITITQPGSYYVDTNNLFGPSGSSGITIAASDVTLDLMGFTLSGLNGSADGIRINPGYNNIVIRNGTLVKWGGYGINAYGANSCQFFNVIVASNYGGIIAGPGSIVVNCQANSNALNGITVSNNSILKDCIAVTNGSGFMAGTNVVITGCSASFNGTNGFATGDNAMISSCTAGQNGDPANSASAGFNIGNYCTIIGCSADANGYNVVERGFTVNGISTGTYCLIKDCSANNCDSGAGITTGTSCKVKDCSACNNDSGLTSPSGDGISVGDLSSVTGCTASYNVYYGIQCGNWCTVTDNTCLGNENYDGPDIYTTGSGNTIFHNFVSTSSAITAGANNLVGTVVTSSSSLNSGSPYANFASPGTLPPN